MTSIPQIKALSPSAAAAQAKANRAETISERDGGFATAMDTLEQAAEVKPNGEQSSRIENTGAMKETSAEEAGTAANESARADVHDDDEAAEAAEKRAKDSTETDGIAPAIADMLGLASSSERVPTLNINNSNSVLSERQALGVDALSTDGNGSEILPDDTLRKNADAPNGLSAPLLINGTPVDQDPGSPDSITEQPTPDLNQGANSLEADAALAVASHTGKGIEHPLNANLTQSVIPSITDSQTESFKAIDQLSNPMTNATAPNVSVEIASGSMQALPSNQIQPQTQIISAERPDWIHNISASIAQAQDMGAEAMELTLTPENLGKVQIRIEMKDGATSVTIVTQNEDAARLFNENQNRLSEMLSHSGLDLANHNAQSESDKTSGSSTKGLSQTENEPILDGTEEIAAPGMATSLVDVVA